MNEPTGLQLRTGKGFQIPSNAMNVGRGSPWNTPFKVKGNLIYGSSPGRSKLLGADVLVDSCATHEQARVRSNELYQLWVDKKIDHLHIRPCLFTKEDVRLKLRGKHLLCNCKEDKICHRDVLLKIAN